MCFFLIKYLGGGGGSGGGSGGGGGEEVASAARSICYLATRRLLPPSSGENRENKNGSIAGHVSLIQSSETHWPTTARQQ